MSSLVPERIIYENNEYFLYSSPFEPYCSAKKLYFTPETSADMGYYCTWELVGDKLYLEKLNGFNEANKPVTEKEYFEKIPVFANWYTGLLRIQVGEILENMLFGYMVSFTEERRIEIESGIVKSNELLENADWPEED
jgi:hypothetical protein